VRGRRGPGAGGDLVVALARGSGLGAGEQVVEYPGDLGLVRVVFS